MLIKPPAKKENSLIMNVTIQPELLDEINEYCLTAGIDDISFFFEKAAQYVLLHDRDWKKLKQKSQNGR